MSGPVPPVSIGLPVFNGEAYLQEALDSLLSQDFGDFELAIGDNASTDGTEEICRDALRRDRRVTYHRSDSNRGAAWNFSRLVHLTRGEYFRWAAHDDVNAPTYLRRCVDVLAEHQDVSLCFSRVLRINSQGRSLGIQSVPTPATQRRAPARARSFLWHRAFPKAAPFGLARRVQLERTDLIKPYRSSDRTFLLQMALHGRFHEIEEPLLLHRTHPDRSVYLPAEKRLAWWDGGDAGRGSLAKWRLLRGYVEAMGSIALPIHTRAETMCYLGGWAFQNASPLSREAIRAAGLGAIRKSVETPT